MCSLPSVDGSVRVADTPPSAGGKLLTSVVTTMLPEEVAVLLADFLSSLCWATAAAACEEPDDTYMTHIHTGSTHKKR